MAVEDDLAALAERVARIEARQAHPSQAQHDPECPLLVSVWERMNGEAVAVAACAPPCWLAAGG